MSDVRREYLERSLQGIDDTQANVSSNAFPTELPEGSENQISDSSVYTLANDQSFLSRNVDLWLRGGVESSGFQGIRPAPAQRSATVNIPSRHSTGMWYILALVLPFFSINNYNHWRCSPSTIINTAELFLTHISRMCDRVRCNVRRLAQNQMSRELLATAMDTILFIYAIGFLILSMYQASIIT